MQVIADDLAVCTDCAMFLANGELPEGEPYRADYENRLNRAVARGENLTNWVLTCDGETEHDDFSWSRCDLCQSILGGSRCGAAILGTDTEGVTR